MNRSMVSGLFAVAALYDGVLGLVALTVPDQMFQWFGVPSPNHWGYVQFPGALLVVFALMFLAVAWDPVRSRNLIPYGVLLKVSYCGVVLGYWASAGIPTMWKPFAIIDIVFAILFVWAYTTLGAEGRLGRSVVS